MRDLLIALMLIGMVVILLLMWNLFPSFWIANLVATLVVAVWAVWLRYFTD